LFSFPAQGLVPVAARKSGSGKASVGLALGELLEAFVDDVEAEGFGIEAGFGAESVGDPLAHLSVLRVARAARGHSS
jgi:hypothetical protein